MSLSRRELLKAHAAAVAAAAAGMTIPAAAQPVAGGVGSLDIKWSKAPCRFCGTGCGVTVAVKDNRVVATHGDPEAEVNRGLNCVKGYFLSKIMYGDDRLLTNALWLLVLSRSTATLSLDCRLRTGQWVSSVLVPAWPRYLALYQLVLVYGTTGLQKLG